MSPTVITYLVYLSLSVALTVWVAHTLFRNGRLFLVDVFAGNAELADAVNRLLVVGFYLVNLGYITLALKLSHEVLDARMGVEAVSLKLGRVLLVLGFMHFTNLVVLQSVRRGANEQRRLDTRLEIAAREKRAEAQA